MIRRCVDATPEIIRDRPVCRIFGEPVLCVFPVGQTVRLPIWYAENSRRIEINCSDMPTALVDNVALGIRAIGCEMANDDRTETFRKHANEARELRSPARREPSSSTL